MSSADRATPGRRRLLAGAIALAALALAPAPGARASGEDAHQAYLAGRRAAGERDEGRVHYQRGITLAREALARDPDDPAGLLWLAANLGGEALTHGKLHALGVIGEIESTLLRLEQRHPTYDRAAGARALGRLYHKAPSIISVGSNAKAAEFLGKALARAPDFPGNWAFAADFYDDRRDCGRARPLALKLRAAPDLDGYGPDAAEWREIAARVLGDCR